jgi:hypothetical protein
MKHVSRIGMDTSKQIFQLHGVPQPDGRCPGHHGWGLEWASFLWPPGGL